MFGPPRGSAGTAPLSSLGGREIEDLDLINEIHSPGLATILVPPV
jgi:hypothetical protein